MYGICHATIVALGCSPGLAFVHTERERSFVYDITDLYKAEVSIPVDFKVTAEKPNDIGSSVRHVMRDEIRNLSIIDRIAHDTKGLRAVESALFIWELGSKSSESNSRRSHFTPVSRDHLL